MASRDVQVFDRTQEAIAQVRGLTGGALTEFAETMTEIGKEECPKRTGNLADSLTFDETREGFRVYSQTGYGGYVHEGTARQQANPFLSRAAEQTIAEFNDGKKWGE